MEGIKDKWVVDESYTPTKNSGVLRKEINTRNGDVRYLKVRYDDVAETQRKGNFLENLKDYVFVTNNFLIWGCLLLAYAFHYITPLALIYGMYGFDEFNTPKVYLITGILVFSAIYGTFNRKYYEGLIAIYTFFIIFILLLLGACFAFYPIYILIFN